MLSPHHCQASGDSPLGWSPMCTAWTVPKAYYLNTLSWIAIVPSLQDAEYQEILPVSFPPSAQGLQPNLLGLNSSSASGSNDVVKARSVFCSALCSVLLCARPTDSSDERVGL